MAFLALSYHAHLTRPAPPADKNQAAEDASSKAQAVQELQASTGGLHEHLMALANKKKGIAAAPSAGLSGLREGRERGERGDSSQLSDEVALSPSHPCFLPSCLPPLSAAPTPAQSTPNALKGGAYGVLKSAAEAALSTAAPRQEQEEKVAWPASLKLGQMYALGEKGDSEGDAEC